MRLRKTMKRPAAAALALSMAVSTAAMPASAAYICDVSQGDVKVSVDEDGNKTITVGGQDVKNDSDGTDDIIITGDNTKAVTSESAPETEETNASRTISEKVQEAARNVVEIINNSKKTLKVILKNLKVDAGDTDKDAMTVSGSGETPFALSHNADAATLTVGGVEHSEMIH